MKEFPVRGFHVDLRVQTMTMSALRELAKTLADYGMNTLVMEWEGSYPYDKHAIISNRFAFTRREIRDFIKHCSGLGIDVIPLQQCFGHVEYIMRHERYVHLRENNGDISQVCPLKVDGNRKLFTDLFKDIASLHPSPYFHIGCDETRLLGNCPECAKKVKSKGVSKLFVDHVALMCDIAIKLGKRPVLWADIILKYPESVAQLPKEAIFVDWNYGWNIKNFGDVAPLQAKGCEFWGAPALRSSPDDYALTKWKYHFDNLKDFVPHCHKSDYTGIILTSWSTSGIYGLERDLRGVLDMHPVRRVYPLSGFRILLDAYAQAIQSEKAIRPVAFVQKYAQDRFGLSAQEGKTLWKVLCADGDKVRTPSGSFGLSLGVIMKKMLVAKKLMAGIEPRRNKKEFEHFRLMQDTRIHYLKVAAIEQWANETKFSLSKKRAAARKLKKLFPEAVTLTKRFNRLNKGYLCDGELEVENNNSNKRLMLLYERLANVS
ncbi:MAG: family 20 glycosylhydrolase [Kiritimatiellae bacterium]|nr:family 20 glycosylhydrolase [Kiritimatiellia bacterium]